MDKLSRLNERAALLWAAVYERTNCTDAADRAVAEFRNLYNF